MLHSDFNSLLEVSVFLNMGFWAFKDVRFHFFIKTNKIYKKCEEGVRVISFLINSASPDQKQHAKNLSTRSEALNHIAKDIFEECNSFSKKAEFHTGWSALISFSFGITSIVGLFAVSSGLLTSIAVKWLVVYILLSMLHIPLYLGLFSLRMGGDLKGIEGKGEAYDKVYETLKPFIEPLAKSNKIDTDKDTIINQIEMSARDAEQFLVGK